MSKPPLTQDAARLSYHSRYLASGMARSEILDERFCPVPGTQHQAVALRVGAALLRHVEARKLGRVLQAPCDVVLAEKVVVQPDLFFVKRERRGLIGDRNMRGTPDLVIEILSRATREKDLRLRRLYTHFGIPEYWAVDSDSRAAETLVWSELGYVSVGIYGKSDRLSSPLLPHFNLCLSKIFEFEDA